MPRRPWLGSADCMRVDERLGHGAVGEIYDVPAYGDSSGQRRAPLRAVPTDMRKKRDPGVLFAEQTAPLCRSHVIDHDDKSLGVRKDRPRRRNRRGWLAPIKLQRHAIAWPQDRESRLRGTRIRPHRQRCSFWPSVVLLRGVHSHCTPKIPPSFFGLDHTQGLCPSQTGTSRLASPPHPSAGPLSRVTGHMGSLWHEASMASHRRLIRMRRRRSCGAFREPPKWFGRPRAGERRYRARARSSRRPQTTP